MLRSVSAFLALFVLSGATVASFQPTKAPVSPDGTVAVVDLPASRHIKNVGSNVDGVGLCVFTSIQHAADWQNIRVLDGFREWMRSKPGGGYPQKVDAMIAAFCKQKGVEVPPYVQHTGGDVAFLELALRTGRMPGVTYAGRDDFYPMKIAHMVNLAYLDAKHGCIIDNNRPGSWVWMSRDEFVTRWKDMQGGWAVVFLAPPPPPHTEAKVGAKGPPCICGEDECKCKPGECPNKCPVMFGQRCGPGGCSGGFCPAPVATPVPAANAPGSLYNGADPIDNPPSDLYEWRAWDNGVGFGWRLKAVGAKDTPTGVVSDKIHTGPEYSICHNGVTRPATKAEAHGFLATNGLSDDSDRWHLTAVGDSAFTDRFLADVRSLPADVKAKLAVQIYAPGHWAVDLFKLPLGIDLRKPGPSRSAAVVGTLPTVYTLGDLDDLLALPGGPVLRPTPPPKMPDPVPPKPVDPPHVEPKPDAPKPDPKSENDNWCYALLAALALLAREALVRK